jgi:hypothetical protein
MVTDMQTAHLENPLFLQSLTPKILNTDQVVETKHNISKPSKIFYLKYKNEEYCDL